MRERTRVPSLREDNDPDHFHPMLRAHVTKKHFLSRKTFLRISCNAPSFAGIKDWTDRRNENIRVIGYRSTLPKGYRTFTITTPLLRLHDDVYRVYTRLDYVKTVPQSVQANMHRHAIEASLDV